MFNLSIDTVILSIINVLVLYFVLKKILFKPITQFMEKRTTLIQENIETAQKNQEQSENLKIELEKKLTLALKEAENIIADAQQRAKKEYDQIIEQAKIDAKNLIEKAKKDIETERDQMFDEIKKDVASIAIVAATKVVEKNMDTDSNKKMIEKFIQEVGAA